MSQKSSTNLSTLSKHMSGETKLQLTQKTIINCLLIPCEAVANPNPVNGELYFDSYHNGLYIYYSGWVQVLCNLIM